VTRSDALRNRATPRHMINALVYFHFSTPFLRFSFCFLRFVQDQSIRASWHSGCYVRSFPTSYSHLFCYSWSFTLPTSPSQWRRLKWLACIGSPCRCRLLNVQLTFGIRTMPHRNVGDRPLQESIKTWSILFGHKPCNSFNQIGSIADSYGPA